MGPGSEGGGDVAGGLLERDAEVRGELLDEEGLGGAGLEGIPEEAGGMVKNVKAGVVWTGDH